MEMMLVLAGSWQPAFLRELDWDEDIEMIFVSDFD
jgi:hypothetical protein